MPAGRLMPCARPANFSLMASSTRCTASLMAAATRSSSMSLSSPVRLSSIDTLLTSCLPVIKTLTRPPPDSPLTSMAATSSCALAMSCCIFCACFMRLPIPPFIDPRLRSVLLDGPHRTGHDFGGEMLLESLHGGVRLDRRIRRPLALPAVMAGELRGCRGGMFGNFNVQPQRPAQMIAQRLTKTRLGITGANLRVAGFQHQPHLVVGNGLETAIAGKCGGHTFEVQCARQLWPFLIARLRQAPGFYGSGSGSVFCDGALGRRRRCLSHRAPCGMRAARLHRSWRVIRYRVLRG